MRRMLIVGVALSLIGLAYAARVTADGPPKKDRQEADAASSGKQPTHPADTVRRYPWDGDQDYDVRCRLAKHLPRVEFEATAFEDVVEQIAALSGVTMVPNWAGLEAAGIEKDAEVSINASDLRADRLLDLILDGCGGGEVELAWSIEGGVVRISTKEDQSRRRITVVCDCTDLLRAEEEELAKYLDRVVKAAFKYSYQDPTRDIEVMERLVRTLIRESRAWLKKELAQAIVSSVEPESWCQNGGNVGSLEFVGTKLVITQTRTAQVQIFDLLEEIRAAARKPPTSGPTWP